MSDHKLSEIIEKAFMPRVRIWFMFDYAQNCLHPRMGKHWGLEPQLAINYLKSIDWIMGIRGMDHLCDPIIAKDMGGLKKLWEIRIDVREIIELIEKGEYDLAIRRMNPLKRGFLRHAYYVVNQIQEGKLGLQSGVSTRIHTRKIEITEEMKEENRRVMEEMQSER